MSGDLLSILTPKNIVIFILIFTRLSGMIISMPVFSTYPIPIQIKIWLMALISFIIFPFVALKINFLVPNSMPLMLVYALKEFLIGFLIGFVSNFLFNAIQMSGQFISLQSGLSVGNVLDPTSGEQVPVIGELYVIMLTMVFFTLKAHQWILSAVYKSFETLPIGIETILKPEFLEIILKMSSEIFTISISFVLPIFCILFVLQVLLGVLSKMIPQLNVFMVAMPVQILLGFLLMLIFLNPMFNYLGTLVQKFYYQIMILFT